MKTKLTAIGEIIALIAEERKIQDINSENFQVSEKISDYKNARRKIDYWRYVVYADYHYFISRILYINHVFEFSMYCGNLCIENYFKSYLLFHKSPIDDKHGITNFLYTCQTVSQNKDDFLFSEDCTTIVNRYQPFETYAKYPLTRERPGAVFVYRHPNSIYLLDYFVYFIRKDILKPKSGEDILLGTNQLVKKCMKSSPELYSSFIKNNFNFPNEFPDVTQNSNHIHIRLGDIKSEE